MQVVQRLTLTSLEHYVFMKVTLPAGKMITMLRLPRSILHWLQRIRVGGCMEATVVPHSPEDVDSSVMLDLS